MYSPNCKFSNKCSTTQALTGNKILFYLALLYERFLKLEHLNLTKIEK